MNSEQPPKNISDLMTQWITRFENHKKKIAAEERITEMKFGTKIKYYIHHAEESTLPSSDKRRHILYQYKNFVALIEEMMKDKTFSENMHHLIERAKANSDASSKKANINKIKQLVSDFENELNHFTLAQKKSQPSSEIKR